MTLPSPGYTDRRARLVVLGILAIAIGLFCFLLAGLTLLVAMRPDLLGMGRGAAGEAGLRSVMPAACVYALIGLAFVLCGFGSIQARRWVRPIMLTMSWTWLAAGALSMILLLAVGGQALLGAAGDAEDLPPGVARAVWLVTLGLVGCLEVALPIVFIWGYRSKDVQLTAEAMHPAPAWTDRCPPQVLGLSIALVAAALLPLPFAFHSVFPVFGLLVTGWPATLLTFALSVCLGYLAWACYRQRPVAWWGLLAMTIALGASTAATCLVVTPEQLERDWGLAPEQGNALRQSGLLGNPWVAGSTLLISLTCVIYLLAIRKYFRREVSPRTRDTECDK